MKNNIDGTLGRQLFRLVNLPECGPHVTPINGEQVTAAHAAPNTELFAWLKEHGHLKTNLVLVCLGASVSDVFHIHERDGQWTVRHASGRVNPNTDV
jgi:hypothetical protein